MNCGGNAAEKILRNCQAEKMIVQSFFFAARYWPVK